MAAAPPPDRCPRCQGQFHCGVQGSSPCPCTTVRLSEATLAQLRLQFQTCLCLTCLRALAAGASLEFQTPKDPA